MVGKTQYAFCKKSLKVPLRLLALNLPSPCIHLFLILCGFAEDCNPSVSLMAKKLSRGGSRAVSRKTVYKHLAILMKANVLSLVEGATPGKVATFKLMPIVDWQEYTHECV